MRRQLQMAVDYYISAKRLNAARTHITAVQSRKNEGDKLGAAFEETRLAVVASITAGTSYSTMTWNPTTKKWMIGAAVYVKTIEDEKYITTKADTTKRDNLDTLPTF
jgi:hypothetical protein